MQLPTQEQFVKDCLVKYWFANMPSDQKWEDAHFPLPACSGEGDTVRLWSADHTVQGLLQSVGFNHRCFSHLSDKTDKFNLTTYYPEYLPLFQQLKSQFNSLHGKKLAELAIGVHALSAEELSLNGKKGGKISGKRNAELKLGIHAPEMLGEGAKITNAQKWQCLVTGYVSNPGGLSTYQKARGISTCSRIKLVDQLSHL